LRSKITNTNVCGAKRRNIFAKQNTQHKCLWKRSDILFLRSKITNINVCGAKQSNKQANWLQNEKVFPRFLRKQNNEPKEGLAKQA
jgi:hypothetical protein